MKLHLSRKKFRRVLLWFFIVPTAVFFMLNFIFPLNVDIKYSQIITGSDGTILHAFLSKDQKWRMMTTANEISPRLEQAILYKEDHWFYYHPGVNPVAAVRALFNNVFQMKRTSGASTITMQVARMLYPKRRTYINKVAECFRAMQLEMNYSKKEILAMYLTLVPYGGNIEGIKAAAYFYYGRQPDKLSIAQIAALAVIPNRPNGLTPGRRNEELLTARNKWLKRMNADKVFSTADIENALNEPLGAMRQNAPALAPHFALRMHSLYPGQAVVNTSLNVANQQKVFAIASNYSKRMANLNIHNAAVFVINNKTNHVEAYIGSANPLDNENSGQVDGVCAVRSPGSTLKPLVYGIAFDKGLLTPKSVLSDVPVNFDGYSPENYNTEFNGNITVENALANSLNIPAVKTLNQLGVATFTDKLVDAGFRQIKLDKDKLGLSTILGGCGVTLEELTAMYASFAHYGKYSRTGWLNDTLPLFSTELITPSASFMLSEILCTLTRPDLPNNAGSSMHVPRIAWKTGTSYGRRDAWSIGYNLNYTVGVWLGNFSGEGVPELSGAEIATPLLFEVFNAIDYNSRKGWFVQPEALDFRLVCSESGSPPGDYCKNQIVDYFIPGVSPSMKCMHVKQVFLSPDEKFSYCTSCVPATGFKVKLYTDVPPELLTYYETEHVAYNKIPPHNPNCTRIFSSKPPQIVSPVNNKEYFITGENDQQLQLKCNAGNEVQLVYWYINDRFYKSCKRGDSIFFSPGKGKIKISCSDDKGRNADIYITASFM
jgi:penicillin-binding protein 1C